MAKKPQYDLDLIRQAASARWPEILAALGGLSPDILDGQHHPCPRCGGTDRFRFFNDGTGGAICNACFTSKNGDGFSVLQWITGRNFVQVMAEVGGYLGIEYSLNGSTGKRGKKDADPEEHLEFLDWNDLSVTMWCRHKPPVTPEAVLAAGGRIARYRHDYVVIALPIWGSNLTATAPVGWVLYNLSGGSLPKFTKVSTGKGRVEWVKVKITHGSQPGVIGPVDRLAEATEVWKVEGVSDVLTFLSLPDVPTNTIAITNANGAKEKPLLWLVELCRGKKINTLHDADKPGQEGALGWTDDRGNVRPGWASAFAAVATESRNVVLPYPIVLTHGKDLRDFASEGHRFADLAALAVQAEPLPASSAVPPAPIESDDDPHRLARVNLDRYARHRDGATLRFWRDEWYTWKPARGCYRKIGEKELKAKVTSAIKEEFNRINVLAQENAIEKPTTVQRVTGTLVNNVLAATASLTIVSSSVEQWSWINQDEHPADHNWVAMKNGILDLDRAIEMASRSDTDETLTDDDFLSCIVPHTPNWFSAICLPYEFDPHAECPKWDGFLEKNLEMDPERIKILQEWAGYMLLPDTGEQKFLVLEGEGANGKSVYCAGLTAMLGKENCSHIPLELFGDRFAKSQTLGKLVNVSADAGELDKVSEGTLKSFTSGDVMYFDRKGISGIDCTPTARLMLACNNRPRFSDRSSGIWRRMLLIPWLITMGRRDRIRNMDKPTWWQASGELPGIFNWALVGLHRLRSQGGFTESALSSEAMEDYKSENNPARSFLIEYFEAKDTLVKCRDAYGFYVRWCEENGYRNLGERYFGKEVKRVFGSNRSRGGPRSDRYWYYSGLGYKTEEICGEKTETYSLF